MPLSAPGPASKQRTAGQLKLACKRAVGEILHVESSLKFFVDALSEADASASALEASMSRFVGPFLHENFAWRLAEARRRVQMIRGSEDQRIRGSEDQRMGIGRGSYRRIRRKVQGSQGRRRNIF